MAHPRDSVPLYVSGLRPVPRAALQVWMGLREHPGADVEAAQLRRCGRLRSPGLRQPDLAAAVLAANATSDRPRLSRRPEERPGHRLRIQPDHPGPARRGRAGHPSVSTALAEATSSLAGPGK